MRTLWQMALVPVLIGGLVSCASQRPEERFVRQRIPVEIQSGKPVTVDIRSLSGNAANEICIQCSPEVWSTLTNGTRIMSVQLESSSKPNTVIESIDPGAGSPFFLGYVTNAHYLFCVGGRHGAKASVEITFWNAPAEPIHADILVGVTPEDTEL